MDYTPYTIDSVIATLERTIRRLWILCIILIIALIGSNAGWIYYESQWQWSYQELAQEMIYLENVTNQEIARAIEEWIHNERDRKILKRRLIDGICYEPLAEEFDMSVRRIKDIVYKHEKVLFKHLK